MARSTRRKSRVPRWTGRSFSQTRRCAERPHASVWGVLKDGELMRPIGFSSGALAKSDYRRGLELQKSASFTAIELSALRERELQPLVDAAQTLSLDQFSYVSFHAPSSF